MLSTLCQPSKHLRRLCVTMPTGNLLSFLWALSQSSLWRPSKDQTFLLPRPGLHGYFILCTSTGSTTSFISLCYSCLWYQFFSCWIAASAAFDLLNCSIRKKGNVFLLLGRVHKPHSVLTESLASGTSYIWISFIILTSKNRKKNRWYCLN